MYTTKQKKLNVIKTLRSFLINLPRRPLTASEVAVYLGLSLGHIYRMARNQKLPATKLPDGRWMFRKVLIDLLRNKLLITRRTKYFDRYFNNKSIKKG